jgi:hypothetical protein
MLGALDDGRFIASLGQHLTFVLKLVRDKHSSLLHASVSDKKELMALITVASTIKMLLL